MKTKTSLAVAVAVLLGFAGLTWADSSMGSATPNNTTTKGSSALPSKTISGSVTNIDTVNNSIQVKDTSGAIQTVVMNQNAVVTKSGQNATIYDLKVGDVVSVKIAPNPTPGS